MGGSLGLIYVGMFCLYLKYRYPVANNEFKFQGGMGFGTIAVICFVCAPISAFIYGAMFG